MATKIKNVVWGDHTILKRSCNNIRVQLIPRLGDPFDSSCVSRWLHITSRVICLWCRSQPIVLISSVSQIDWSHPWLACWLQKWCHMLWNPFDVDTSTSEYGFLNVALYYVVPNFWMGFFSATNWVVLTFGHLLLLWSTLKLFSCILSATSDCFNSSWADR